MQEPKFRRISGLVSATLVVVVSMILFHTWRARSPFEIKFTRVTTLHSIQRFTQVSVSDTNAPWIAAVRLRESASGNLIFDYEKANHWVQVRVQGRWMEPLRLTSLSDVNTFGLYNYGMIYIPVPDRAEAVRLLLKWRPKALTERVSEFLSKCVGMPSTNAFSKWAHRWFLCPLHALPPFPPLRQSTLEIVLPPHQEWLSRFAGRLHNHGIQRMGASRLCHLQFEAHRRLAPTADAAR